MTADAVGGVWTYALDLAYGLSAAGATTTLAVLGAAPSPDQWAEAAVVPGLRIRTLPFPLDWMAGCPEEIRAAGRHLAGLAAEIGASVVHLNSPSLAAEARFPVPVVGTCHSCLASWWEAVREGPLPAEFRWPTRILADGYARADALMAPSRAFAAVTGRLYGIAPPVAVHNGRRGALGGGPGQEMPALAFTAGRLWDEGKNAAALDAAAESLPVPVLAAGPTSGPNGAGIVLRHMRPLGRLSGVDIAAHLARRPVFVSTALYEPFGLSVLEAARAGCALVLSDIPTFRELWDGAAEFVRPRDVPAIRGAVLRMTEDRERRWRFGVAARERARGYDLGAMTAGVLEVYHRVLRAAGTPPAGRDAAA